MKIIPAAVDDIFDLAALVQSCYRGESSRQGWTNEADIVEGTRTTPEMLKADLEKPGVVILKVVDDQNQIIGCVHTELEADNKIHVGMLCVRTDLQNAGLGKKIMAAVDTLAKEKDCQAATIVVITKRTELIAFYERRGYRATGKKEPFPADAWFGKAKMPLEFIEMQKNY